MPSRYSRGSDQWPVFIQSLMSKCNTPAQLTEVSFVVQQVLVFNGFKTLSEDSKHKNIDSGYACPDLPVIS